MNRNPPSDLTIVQHQQAYPEDDVYRAHVRLALRKIPGARSYAVDDQTITALAAFLKAHANDLKDKGEEVDSSKFAPLLEKLFAHEKSMTQQRPEETPFETLIPTESLFETKAVNPWASPPDLGSQNIVQQRYPRLAEYLKRLAQDGGYTFKHAAELQDAATSRALYNSFPYGQREAVPEINPFLGQDRAVQAKFIESEPPEKVALYQAEAEPARLSFERGPRMNRTQLGGLLNANPELGKIALKSQRIAEDWHQAAEQRAAAEVAEAEKRHKAALANLHGKAAADRRTLTSLEPAPTRKFGDPLPRLP